MECPQGRNHYHSNIETVTLNYSIIMGGTDKDVFNSLVDKRVLMRQSFRSERSLSQGVNTTSILSFSQR